MCTFIASLQRRPRCVCCADKKKIKKTKIKKEGKEIKEEKEKGKKKN